MRFRSAAIGLVLVACYSSGEGKSPPLDRIYFPVGLAIDKEQKRLYVASSDFDLQFNAGSIQALDLERVRELIPQECQTDADCSGKKVCDSSGESPTFFCVTEPQKHDLCGALGVQTDAERDLTPGRCKYVDLTAPADDPSRPILFDSVGIGAFAADIQLRYSPEGDKGRLFVPVRGEASLHWIDLDTDGKMHCDQSKSSPNCASKFRVGTDPDENTRNEKMPTEPYGMAINDEGDAIVTTHQTSGQVALFHQDLLNWERGPKLEYVHGDLPTQALAVASVPSPLLVREAREEWLNPLEYDNPPAADPFPPGFLVAYRNAAQVDLLRYYSDGESSPTRPYLQLAATVSISANAIGTDSRGIVYDDSARKACETDCVEKVDTASDTAQAERQTCLASCAAMPIAVYVANRGPASLLVGKTTQDTLTTPNRDVPKFTDVVPLSVGPSRVYMGKVVGDDGALETRVFIVSFDSQVVSVYDPSRRRIDARVMTGRGPHALAFDFAPADDSARTPARALAYVAHFTDSYVGVIELDRRKLRTYGTLVLSLGPATAPRASK